MDNKINKQIQKRNKIKYPNIDQLLKNYNDSKRPVIASFGQKYGREFW